MAAAGIPKFLVIEHPYTGSYMCPVENSQAPNQPSHFLEFAESQIFSPGAKFAAEESETGDATLVHIRSCFNNKYWVAYETNGEFLIAVSADKPEEDVTNPGCTLFRVKASLTETKGSGFVFQDMRLSRYVTSAFVEGPLMLSNTGTNVFLVRDWGKLVRLPSRVTFKSPKDADAADDEADKYLRVFDDPDGYNYNKLDSGFEYIDPRVGFQLFPTSQGYYSIKSLDNGRFWRKCEFNNLIRNDSEYAEKEDRDSMFECIVIRDNMIALRNMGNNLFCGVESGFLTAKYSTASKETRFIIGEPVMRRDISIAEYHLPRSRIFEAEVLALAEVTIQNRSPNIELEQVIKFSESIDTTYYWNHTLSVSLSLSVGIKVAAVPFIVKGEITAKLEGGYTHKWQESRKEGSKVETNTKVVVPKSTTMKVTLLCTKATCDVPFSYIQYDLQSDGRMVSKVNDDGIYTGVNVYDFNIRSVEVDEHGEELKLIKDEPAFVTFTKIIPKEE